MSLLDIQPFDLDVFVRHLKRCVSCPRHLRVYEIGRKILHHHHQLPFAKEVPEPSVTKISLSIQSRHDIGFKICGGAERGLPIYCSHITSQRVRKSTINPTRIPLQVGDLLLKVNTISLKQCTSKEANEILKQQLKIAGGTSSGNKLTLTGTIFNYFNFYIGKIV